jgi:hypothetical protein
MVSNMLNIVRKRIALTEIGRRETDCSYGPFVNRRNIRPSGRSIPSVCRLINLLAEHRRLWSSEYNRSCAWPGGRCLWNNNDSRRGYDVHEPTVTHDVGSHRSHSFNIELGCCDWRTFHRLPPRTDRRNTRPCVQAINGPCYDAGSANGILSDGCDGPYGDDSTTDGSTCGSDGNDLQELWRKHSRRGYSMSELRGQPVGITNISQEISVAGYPSFLNRTLLFSLGLGGIGNILLNTTVPVSRNP